MSKWNLIIDIENCTNCNMCVLACQDEYHGNEFPGYTAEMPKHGHRWIEIMRKERGAVPMIDVAYLPVMCQHCDNAPCIKAAENGAVTKRSDGIVLIDPEKAKGQKQLVESCPYKAIWWNDDLQLPQHWIFDAHLLDEGWKEPRAAIVCATAAITAKKVDDTEMAKIVEAEGLEVLHPEYNAKPRVYYKNLHLYNKCFIGGSVTTEKDGFEDCVKDARVRLIKNTQVVAEATTDYFGDFKFDRLDENSGAYTIVVEAGSEKKSVNVELGESVTLADIYI